MSLDLEIDPAGSAAPKQPPARVHLSFCRRLDLALMLVLALTTASPGAVAQLRDAPWGPNQSNANDLEIRRDALPAELPVDEIEVVVEASDEYCKPKSSKLLGISIPVPVAPAASFFCQQMAAYLNVHAGALPVQLSRQIWSKRKAADQVAGLDVALQRRYVLLSRWRAYDVEMNPYGLVPRMRWVVEEVLWDRAESKPLWHALRNIYTNDVYEGGRVWGIQLNLRRYFEFTLPATLSSRGVARAHAPVPDGRWIATEQITGWQSTSRAAIAFVNSYAGPGVRDFRRSKSIRVRSATQAPYLAGKVDWASDAWMRMGHPPETATTPPMDFGTHALLEVPPGRYVIDPYDPSRAKALELDLKPGEIAVIEFSRKVVGADGPELADIKTWQKELARGRHAFLEDSRVLPDPWQIESWFFEP